MRKLSAVTLVLLLSLYCSAQIIPNKYAAVLSRSVCDNSFGVDTATGFNVGDTVLMIQMKGATIDSSNTINFGNILSLNGAGNYELNVIKAVSGNNITLKYKVVRNYDIPVGRVQFVRVANYSNYTISTSHTCGTWTGTKGGVFIINVPGTLTVNSTIDVSGKGFRGGKLNGGLTYTCDKPDYFYPLAGNNGAMKGEGIAEISVQKLYGKGKLGNGGGGGNSTNAGGGGGGNAALAGNGGHQWSGGSCDTSLASGGYGGLGLPYSAANNRLYMGGGGGAGHENNGNTDSAGNGGGIVIINAGTFAGSSSFIRANGANCIDVKSFLTPSAGDGQSAGGGGGAVVLKVTTFSTTPIIEAKGGNGGNVYSTAALHGPGGGGSGGAVMLAGASLSSSNINVAGGTNGTVVNFTGSSFDAQSGSNGTFLSSFPYILPIDTFKPNVIIPAFTDSIVSCFTRKMINGSTTSAIGISSYSWDAGVAGTSTATNPTFTFPDYGTYSVRLIVTDSNGCKDSLRKNVIIPYTHFANAGHDTISCRGIGIMLHATGGITYSWSPASTLTSPNAANTLANPIVTTSYIVTVTNSAGCIDKDTVLVSLALGKQVVASNDTSVCLGKTVPLHATGVVYYQWSPSVGLSNALVSNPIATFAGDISYVVTGKDSNGCISFDTVNITEQPGPVIDAYSIDGNNISCYAQSIRLKAMGGVRYTWHPGIYTNDSTIPSPIVAPPATTLFTVIGVDATGCFGTDTISIYVLDKAVYMPNAFTPNGDHINDDIRPTLVCDFRLDSWEIYDRWGKVVFSSTNLNKGWDGRYNDEPQPMDVYVYYIKGKNADGKSVVYKGNITLIR